MALREVIISSNAEFRVLKSDGVTLADITSVTTGLPLVQDATLLSDGEGRAQFGVDNGLYVVKDLTANKTYRLSLYDGSTNIPTNLEGGGGGLTPAEVKDLVDASILANPSSFGPTEQAELATVATIALADNGDGTFKFTNSAGVETTVDADKILENPGALTGAIPAGKDLGINTANGDIYGDNGAGQWQNFTLLNAVAKQADLTNHINDAAAHAGTYDDSGLITQINAKADAADLHDGAVQDTAIALNTTHRNAAVEHVPALGTAGQIMAVNAAADGTEFVTPAAGHALLDEDDMVSDSDTAGATQQSIKAYADGLPFGILPIADIAGRPAAPRVNEAVFQQDTKELLSWNGTAWVSLIDSIEGIRTLFVALGQVTDGVNVLANADFTARLIGGNLIDYDQGQDKFIPFPIAAEDPFTFDRVDINGNVLDAGITAFDFTTRHNGTSNVVVSGNDACVKRVMVHDDGRKWVLDYQLSTYGSINVAKERFSGEEVPLGAAFDGFQLIKVVIGRADASGNDGTEVDFLDATKFGEATAVGSSSTDAVGGTVYGTATDLPARLALTGLKVGDEILQLNSQQYFKVTALPVTDQNNWKYLSGSEARAWYDNTTTAFDANSLLIANTAVLIGFDSTATVANMPLNHTTNMTGFISVTGDSTKGLAIAFISEHASPLGRGIWTRTITADTWAGSWVRFTEDEWVETDAIIGTLGVPIGSKIILADGKDVSLTTLNRTTIEAVRVVPRNDWSMCNAITTSEAGWTLQSQPQEGTQEILYVPNHATNVWECKQVEGMPSSGEWVDGEVVDPGDLPATRTLLVPADSADLEKRGKRYVVWSNTSPLPTVSDTGANFDAAVTAVDIIVLNQENQNLVGNVAQLRLVDTSGFAPGYEYRTFAPPNTYTLNHVAMFADDGIDTIKPAAVLDTNPGRWTRAGSDRIIRLPGSNGQPPTPNFDNSYEVGEAPGVFPVPTRADQIMRITLRLSATEYQTTRYTAKQDLTGWEEELVIPSSDRQPVQIFSSTEEITEVDTVRYFVMPPDGPAEYVAGEPYDMRYTGAVPYTPSGTVGSGTGLAARLAEGWVIVGPNTPVGEVPSSVYWIREDQQNIPVYPDQVEGRSHMLFISVSPNPEPMDVSRLGALLVDDLGAETPVSTLTFQPGDEYVYTKQTPNGLFKKSVAATSSDGTSWVEFSADGFSNVSGAAEAAMFKPDARIKFTGANQNLAGGALTSSLLVTNCEVYFWNASATALTFDNLSGASGLGTIPSGDVWRLRWLGGSFERVPHNTGASAAVLPAGYGVKVIEGTFSSSNSQNIALNLPVGKKVLSYNLLVNFSGGSWLNPSYYADSTGYFSQAYTDGVNLNVNDMKSEITSKPYRVTITYADQ